MLERDHEEKGIAISRQDFLVTLARSPQRNPFPDRNEPNARHFLVFFRVGLHQRQPEYDADKGAVFGIACRPLIVRYQCQKRAEP